MKYTVKEILDMASEYKDDYETIAIRTQDVPFDASGISHNSKIWVNGEELSDELDGISATDINSAMIVMHSSEHTPRTGYYYGNYVAIVCGDLNGMGDDEGEVIIKNAKVLKVLS